MKSFQGNHPLFVHSLPAEYQDNYPIISLKGGRAVMVSKQLWDMLRVGVRTSMTFSGLAPYVEELSYIRFYRPGGAGSWLVHQG